MARAPVEWPIPEYVLELRERVVIPCRVPLRALGGRIPAPLAPSTVAGQGIVSLSLGNSRCLKSVGGVPTLASEFHLAELVTPAVWQPACRPALRGNLLLAAFSDTPGLSRLIRTACGFGVRPALLSQHTERGRSITR
ncbi:MAG TPA: hypothetical protein VFU47_11910, partial [Armatimonadota bacterium]|nr:hypothetical protein [Armatimonadota bacterium]